MKKIILDLEEFDGNAFSVMSAFSEAARMQGWTADEIKKVINDALSGDYDHTFSIIQSYCE